MKILVTKLPKNPKECLFSQKKKCSEYVLNGDTKSIFYYYCSMNKKLCNLYTNEKCGKLKSLEKLLEEAYENYNKK